MYKFIFFFVFIILQGCYPYSGTFFQASSNIGKVVNVGHCGDTAPSAVEFQYDNIKFSVKASDISENGFYIWFQALSDVPFKIELLNKNIQLLSNNSQVNIENINYFYLIDQGSWVSENYSNISQLPNNEITTKNFRITFKIKKVDGLNFKINNLKIQNHFFKRYKYSL